VLAVVCCALGMGSKEVMAAAPIVMLLYDRIFLSQSWRDVFSRRWAVHLGLMLTWFVIPAALLGAYLHAKLGEEFDPISLWTYLKTQANVIAHYLRLSIWPRPLVVDYYGWPLAESWRDAIIGGPIVLALFLATLWALWKRPTLGFLGAWFFLILAPTSSILPLGVEVAAERRMYLPLVAVVVLIVIGVRALLDRMHLQRAGFMLTTVIVIVFMIMTLRRNHDYRDELTIWSDTIAKRPENPRARYNYGQVLAREGSRSEAIAEYRKTLELAPGFYQAHYKLAVSLAAAGELDAAIDHYGWALTIHPYFPEAHLMLGEALQQRGDLDDAVKHFREALKLRPDYPAAQRVLDAALARRP
jgi:tetratricopeptide (TPR) repeat protein